MPITTIRIHPAIGIARLGNSTDFFIGPLRPGDRTPPAGGYKDAACRVKRQGAQFRLYAYDQNDQLLQEITAADGTIKWTVHLANRKAVSPGFSNPDLRNKGVVGADRQKLVIDPGERSVTGPNQTAAFDNGTFTGFNPNPPKTVVVPLGEMRSDNEARLVVLGGSGKSASPTGRLIQNTFNNDDWYDDISDGPVTATVEIGAKTFNAVASWVIVSPPKFAPPIDNPITLYDRLLQFFIDSNMLPPFNDPAPSYVKYIHPIIRAAKEVWGVVNVGNVHMWDEPVTDDPTRHHIFGRLNPPGNMPLLAGGARLTATQYSIMQKWNAGSYQNDWPPPAPGAITPAGLDQAALENAVGAAFFPGIEAGDFLISDKNNYSAPWRLNPAKVNPGDVSARMAIPWQTDFGACASNWWPPERPNQVIPSGQSSYQDWARGITDMVTQWSTLGFVVNQGGKFREVERCSSPFINLLTHALNFQDVPQAPMGMSRKTALAIAFEVETDNPLTLDFLSGPTHPRLQRLGGNSVSIAPTGTSIAIARLWITYETGPVGEILTDSVTVQEPVSGQQWTVPITANTVSRKKAAAALVLDHSGSMTEDRGDGQSKIQALREATSIFVDAMLQEDAVALIRFNQDAQTLQGVTALGSPADPFDPGRTNIKNVIASNQLDPAGQTSIGDGIFEGRNALNAAAGFDVKSLVVLTDGMENSPKFIADVASSINEFTYAIGLGKPENISVSALQNISGNHGGYLLVTGAISGDNRFLLQKYFLQILAGISNAEIALDPQGQLHDGAEVRIPFHLTEADAGVDVILLSPYPQRINFRVQTPAGHVLDAAEARVHAGVQYVTSNGITYYRIRLPFEFLPQRFDDRGAWTAILSLGRPSDTGAGAPAFGSPAFAQERTSFASQAPPSSFPAVRNAAAVAAEAVVQRLSLPYSLVVHTYSEIRLFASVQQSGFQPGATVDIHARVTQYDSPIETGVRVAAEVVRPGGTRFSLELASRHGDEFAASFAASEAGVYRIRVLAAGKSASGWPFRREKTLTASTYHGSGRPPVGPGAGGQPGTEISFCSLLECILRSGVLTPEAIRRWKDQGIDVERLIDCFRRECEARSPQDDR